MPALHLCHAMTSPQRDVWFILTSICPLGFSLILFRSHAFNRAPQCHPSPVLFCPGILKNVLSVKYIGIAVQVSDRFLMGMSLACCAIGCLFMISFTGNPVPLACYLISFTLVLSFTNVLEGVSMSILSKVIHPDMAKGTFNAGEPAT
jgi:hypothetical protein